MISASIIRTTAVVLFAFSAIVANAETFNVSKVSWASDGLRIEIKTDLPDETELNLVITDDKNGYNYVSQWKSHFTVKGGRFFADGFATDLNDEPFRPGHYWVSIGKGTDVLPRIAVLPITVPKDKSKTALLGETKVDSEQEGGAVAEHAPVFNVSTSWADDVLRITGKTDLLDGMWLNVAIVDDDGTLVADEGFICAQVKGGRVTVEGFTKDGWEPLLPGHYKLSVKAQNPVQSGAFSVEKPLTVTKRPKFTKSRLAEVRAINSANYANAKENVAAATKSEEVSDSQKQLSDALLQNSGVQSVLNRLTVSGALRVDCSEAKAWIDPMLWRAGDAQDKENIARAVFESCGRSIDIYDAQSAKKLARYGSVRGFRVY